MKFEIASCRLTTLIVNTLAAIAENIGRLAGVNLSQPSLELRRKNRIRTIQASLAIEGNSLTRDQVTALLHKNRVIGPPRDILEVENAIEAYRRLSKFNPFAVNSLLKAHRIMMKGLVADPGSFRRGAIGVLREKDIFHVAPRWENVEPMMHALFHYLKTSDDHLLIKSARFHFQLEHIHPFIDGNGRMGRYWQTCILMHYHPVFEFLPVEHLIRAHQQEYYRSLAMGDDTGDCTVFVAFILTQLARTLEQLIEDTRGVTLTAENRLGIAQGVFGKELFSRKDYQNLLKTISAPTASRDLKQGVKKGLLKRSGDKRTTVYRFIHS
ncbi:MAG: Fic family protein [Deltaproteobacteria bacterium]|nr:Fic family protein [Deltaproteobacteria bacterium]